MKKYFIQILIAVLFFTGFNTSITAATHKVWKKDPNSFVRGSFRYAVHYAKDGDTISFVQSGKLMPITELIYIDKNLSINGWNKVRKERTLINGMNYFRFKKGSNITFKNFHIENVKSGFESDFKAVNLTFSKCIIRLYRIDAADRANVLFERCQFMSPNAIYVGGGADVCISNCRVDGHFQYKLGKYNWYRGDIRLNAFNGGKVKVTNSCFPKEILPPDRGDGETPASVGYAAIYRLLDDSSSIVGSFKQAEKYNDISHYSDEIKEFKH